MRRVIVSVGVLMAVAGAVNAQGQLGFAGMSGSDGLQAFDPQTGGLVGAQIDLLPEGDYPYDATIKPDGSEVWITGASGDGVVVVDAVAPAVLERIDLTGVAEYAVDVIFEPCGTRAFVASRDSEVVAVIDTQTYSVIDTVDIPTNSLGAGKMAISRQRNELYVVDWFSDLLVTVDLDTLGTSSVVLGDSFWDLAISPDENTLYVLDRGTDQVRVVDIDTMMVTDNVTAGDDPWGLDVTPDGSTVVVANEDDNTVTVFDTTSLIPETITLPADADPRDVEIAAAGDLAYVPSGDVSGNDQVYVIDIDLVANIGSIDVGTSNTNVVAVRPQPGACEIFTDGFESGDTSAWSLTIP